MFDTQLPDTLTEAFDKLCEFAPTLRERITFEPGYDQRTANPLPSDCWIPSNPQVKVDSKAYALRNLAYELTWGRKPLIRRLASTCGSSKCINPDHLTDKIWGEIEDFNHLLDMGVLAQTIPERLGITNLGHWFRDQMQKPGVARLYERWQAVTTHEDVDEEEGAEVIDLFVWKAAA